MNERDYILSVLDYDPFTGRFIWKPRPLEMFAPSKRFKAITHYRSWTTSWAGKEAGTLSPKGYAKIQIKDKVIFAHHIAWLIFYREWPPDEIDHINGARSDNRISNLRLATVAENAQNRGMSRNNTTGYNGVFWIKQNQKWVAKFAGFYLGLFETAEEAYAATLTKKTELHSFQPVPR